MPEEERKYLPIEKREIRGLTMENIIKYGAFLLFAMFGYFTMQKKIDAAELKNTEQDAVIQLLRTDNETGKIKIQTLEITMGRIDERVTKNTQRLK